MSHDHHAHGHAHDHGSDHGMRPHLQASSPELAGFLAGLPTPPRAALDIGCGRGADAIYLAGLGIETTGIDLSADALEAARAHAAERGVDVTFRAGDALDLPFADASLDLVTDRGCLHHVAREDQPRYAREVARVLRPGGVLLVREHNHPGHHELAVTEDDIRSMVDGTPLTVRSITPFEVQHGRGSIPGWITVVDRT